MRSTDHAKHAPVKTGPLRFLIGGCLALNIALPTTSAATGVPDLSISKTHVGNFTNGQVGATYLITVSNALTAGPTDGTTVTVTDLLPDTMTATSIGGMGWACTQPSGPCTRNDLLNAGSSYPALTLTVNLTTWSLVENGATVAGGGDVTPGNDHFYDVAVVDCSAHLCNSITSTRTEVTSVGPTNAIFITTTTYVGPQSILVGSLGFCSVPPAYTGCSVQSGSGTLTDPFVMGGAGCALSARPSGCASGTLAALVPGFTNFDTIIHTQIAQPAVVSRKVHGTAGTFDLPLSVDAANPTTEPRSGPTHTIVFTFDSAVTGATAAVTEGIGVAGAPTFNNNEVTVGLTGVADQQYVTVMLADIDGTGGSVSVRLGFLRGDVNQNRVVTLADLGLVNAQLAQFVTQANFLKDVNASGTLSVADKGLSNTNLTRNLPAP